MLLLVDFVIAAPLLGSGQVFAKGATSVPAALAASPPSNHPKVSKSRKVPSRLVLGLSMGYMPFPDFQALMPVVSIGPHWDFGLLDFRLLFEFGPTIVPKGGQNIRLQIFAIAEFFLDFSPIYLAPAVGVGGGVYEYLMAYRGDNCSGATADQFLALVFLGFGAGYTDGHWSVGPSVRLYIGDAYLSEYCVTNQGVVIEEKGVRHSLAISLHVELKYAW